MKERDRLLLLIGGEQGRYGVRSWTGKEVPRDRRHLLLPELFCSRPTTHTSNDNSAVARGLEESPVSVPYHYICYGTKYKLQTTFDTQVWS